MIDTIGSVATKVHSIDPRKLFSGSEFNYVDISALDQDSKTIRGAKSVPAMEAPSRARQLLKAGDILISTVRPNLNAVALVPAELEASIASTGFCVLRPDQTKAHAPYLFHWVKSRQFIEDMVRKATGASYPAVSDRIIFDSMVPLPPLDEQRRIAAILDQAEELRAKRRAAIALLDQLPQAIFLEMFCNPVSNPMKWPTQQFGTLAETRLGKMLDKKKQSGETPLPYLGNSNLRWFKFDLVNLQTMTFTEKERSILRLRAGDVLICEGGEPGRAAIWNNEMTECYFQKALHRARPDLSKILPQYLVHCLHSLASGGGLKDFVTVATIAHLTGEKLRVLPIPTPPIDLQQVFTERVESVYQAKASHQSALTELDALFASLQSGAFSK